MCQHHRVRDQPCLILPMKIPKVTLKAGDRGPGWNPPSPAKSLSTRTSISGTQRGHISVPPFLESQSLSGLLIDISALDIFPSQPLVSMNLMPQGANLCPRVHKCTASLCQLPWACRRIPFTTGPGDSPGLGSWCTSFPSPLRTGMCVIWRGGVQCGSRGSREGGERPLRPRSLHISKHRWERGSEADLRVTHV